MAKEEEHGLVVLGDHILAVVVAVEEGRRRYIAAGLDVVAGLLALQEHRNHLGNIRRRCTRSWVAG